MTAKHLERGRQGEDFAASFVEELGWKILDRNVVFRGGELDIVAMDSSELVIAEVRTRAEGWMQPGEDSVGPRKLGRLVRSGRLYTDMTGWEGPWRIDILSVTMKKDGTHSIERFEDVTGGAWFS